MALTEDEAGRIVAQYEVECEIKHLRKLTEEQRLEVFAEFCTYCGGDDPSCSCMRDC